MSWRIVVGGCTPNFEVLVLEEYRCTITLRPQTRVLLLSSRENLDTGQCVNLHSLSNLYSHTYVYAQVSAGMLVVVLTNERQILPHPSFE